jgi:hypothetical protein
MKKMRFAVAMLAASFVLAGCAGTETKRMPPPPPVGTTLPYGIPTKRPGLVKSPWSPDGPLVDVTGFATGTVVKDPTTNKDFLVP